MNSVSQVVIRNVSLKGYDIIHESRILSQQLDVEEVAADFLFNYVLGDPHPYFVKYRIPESNLFLVGLVHPDGNDEHGRAVFRIHLLFIDKESYHEKALPFWISPLIYKPEKVGTRLLSLRKDFRNVSTVPTIPPTLVESILLKTESFYYLDVDPLELNVLASLIDKAIPMAFNETFSIISHSCTMKFKKIPELAFVKILGKNVVNFKGQEGNMQPSSCDIVNLLCKSVEDDELRRIVNERIDLGSFESEKERFFLKLMKSRFNAYSVKGFLKYKFLELQRLLKYPEIRT